MSTEFLFLLAVILIIGAVLFFRKHPDVTAQIHARLDETETRVQAMIDNRKPAAAADPVVGTVPPAPTIDHVGIVNAAMTGAAQVVSALPSNPFASYGVGQVQRLGPNGFPLDAAGREILPATAGDYSGNDLWRKASQWRCQLDAGASDSRKFIVPDGWVGQAEYTGDNAALQGDFTVTLDDQPLVGAGQQVSLTPGPHTLAVKCVSPLSVGRTFAFANLGITHNP